jgi:hypothetical protein
VLSLIVPGDSPDGLHPAGVRVRAGSNRGARDSVCGSARPLPSRSGNARRQPQGGRGSLGACRAGARLSRSAGYNEQADDENEDDELKGDAYGLLKALSRPA